MDNPSQADDLSLAPLVISPDVVAAQARVRADETTAPVVSGAMSEDPVNQLQACSTSVRCEKVMFCMCS